MSNVVFARWLISLKHLSYDDLMAPARSRSKRTVAGDVWRMMARFTLGQVQRGGQFELLREHGLTPGHLKALAMLDADEPRPMGAMAEGLRCDASQVTWLVDRLEERGFVERRPLATDRRVKTVALTDAGVAFRARVLEHLYEPPDALLSLDAGTLESLRTHLERLPDLDGDAWPGGAGR
jgi:DNA-binding MarR family transcriptional regulator